MSDSGVGGGFDNYANEYDAALARGISVSGEDKDYFARGRVAWLARNLRILGAHPARVMEFGCGNGSNSVILRDLLDPKLLTGVDLSVKLIEIANQKYGGRGAQFLTTSEFPPDGTHDLIFCNGVFHHIPPSERASAIDYIYRSLKPGGLFALWENNPWNPGTRWVMSRIPFDRDAVMVTHSQARILVESGGFEVLRTDFLFIFPRILRWLRPLELLLVSFPFGAQYELLCRSSASS